MKKNDQGFTLVELIVVIAILGILAGIAIPVYSGYIAKAKEAADLTLLDSVNTAAQFAVVDKNVNGKVESIKVTVGTSPTIVIKWTDGDDDTADEDLSLSDVSLYLDGNSFASFKCGAKSADLNAKAPTPRWTFTY